MSSKIKCILLPVLSIFLVFCIALSANLISNNGTHSAYAIDTETQTETEPVKEVYEWTADTTGLEFIEDGSGNGAGKLVSPLKGIISTDKSAYDVIIKKAITINGLDSVGGANTGIGFITYFENNPYTSDGNRWQNTPRLRLYSDCFYVSNAFGRGNSGIGQVDTQYKYNKSPDYDRTDGYHPYNKWVSGAQGLPDGDYYVYFGIENNFVDATAEVKVVESFDIYVKLTNIEGTETFIDYTFNQVPLTAMTMDLSEDEGNMFYISSNHNLSASATPKFREFSQYAKVDALEHDEDISYYWNKTAKDASDANKGLEPSNDIKVVKDLELTVDSYFYTPDFDNRFSFKFVADDSEGYFTNYGKVKFVFGQRWTGTVFYLDYKADKIGIYTNKPSEVEKSTAFVLDIEKAYKVSLVIRDIRDNEGELIYRLPTIDVAEIGNETNCVSLCMISNDLVVYDPTVSTGGSSFVETHFKVQDKDDYYYTDDRYGFRCTLSAIEPWYDLTVVDGETTKTDKIKGGNEVVTLTKGADEGKTFIGWLTSANENEIYTIGKAPLNENTTYTALYLDTFAVINEADIKLGNVQLRYRATIKASDWETVNKFVTFGFNVVSGITPLSVNDGVELIGDGEEKTLNIVFAVDEVNYQTEYVAKATFTVTYANEDGVVTVETKTWCKNSASHIAKYALDNPEEVGATNGWSQAYIDEFNRIIGEVAGE